VRVMCKPGSVGDLGGQPPRSTRPKESRPQGVPDPKESDPKGSKESIEPPGSIAAIFFQRPKTRLGLPIFTLATDRAPEFCVVIVVMRSLRF